MVLGGGGGNGPVRGMCIGGLVVVWVRSVHFKFERRDCCTWCLRSVSFHGTVSWGVCEG